MDFRELVKVGAHFGHIKSRFNPKMSPYIWGIKNNVHLIDVSKTAILIEKAAKFLKSVASEGKPVLWIGTKKPAKETIKAVAKSLGMPYVSHRWIGGTLSNFSQVKKSVTKLLHYEDVLAKSEKFPHYTKKELNVISKNVDRLKNNIGGITGLKWPIGAVVMVDVYKEMSALKEAATVDIPVVALIDTNGDPSLVDYVIPANDDSVRSIKLIIDYLAESVAQGKKAYSAAKNAELEKKHKDKDVKPKAEPVPAKELKKLAPAKEVKEVAVAKKDAKPKAAPAQEAKEVAKPALRQAPAVAKAMADRQDEQGKKTEIKKVAKPKVEPAKETEKVAKKVTLRHEDKSSAPVSAKATTDRQDDMSSEALAKRERDKKTEKSKK